VNTDNSIQVAQQKGFDNGIFPVHSVILAKDANGQRPRLTDPQQRQLIGAIRKRYSGAYKNGEPFIVDGMVEKIEKLSNSPAEMGFMDSGKQTKSRIMQAFGVNPLIVGEIEGANRAQAVVAEQSFCNNVINPILDLLGQVFTSKIAPVFATGNERLVVWYEPAEARDPEMRLRRWETGIKAGVVRANEVRTHLLNLPEDDALDGQFVGGKDMGTSRLIEQGISQMITDSLGTIGADSLLSSLGIDDGSKNQNGNGSLSAAGRLP
jgi:phage portal protein BeeE